MTVVRSPQQLADQVREAIQTYVDDECPSEQFQPTIDRWLAALSELQLRLERAEERANLYSRQYDELLAMLPRPPAAGLSSQEAGKEPA